jgi:hypothetical protein
MVRGHGFIPASVAFAGLIAACTSTEGLAGSSGDSADASADAANGDAAEDRAIADAISDGAAIDGGGCDRTKPFELPIAVPGLAGGTNDSFGTLFADELAIVYTRNGTLSIATRGSPGAAFTNGGNLPVGGNAFSGSGAVSPDGLRLVLTKINGSSGDDIFITARGDAGAPFPAATQLAGVNSLADEGEPSFAGASQIVYFARQVSGNGRIHRAAPPSYAPSVIDEIAEGTANDFAPVVAGDELLIYFSSSRGLTDDYDIWTAQRSSPLDRFATPVKVTELSTNVVEEPHWLSPDACRLYFSRETAPGTRNLFVAKRDP